jgi:hypothetical protein
MRRADLWDPELEARARELFIRGLTCRQIGDLLHKTRNAIVGKLQRMGLQRLGPRPAGQAKNTKRAYNGANGAAEQHLPETLAKRRHEPDLSFAAKAAPGYAGKPLLKLKFGQCRYPIGDGDPADYLFCAAPTLSADSSWCTFHHAICTQRAHPIGRSFYSKQ